MSGFAEHHGGTMLYATHYWAGQVILRLEDAPRDVYTYRLQQTTTLGTSTLGRVAGIYNVEWRRNKQWATFIIRVHLSDEGK